MTGPRDFFRFQEGWLILEVQDAERLMTFWDELSSRERSEPPQQKDRPND